MTNKNSNKPLWYSLNTVIVHDSDITENGHYYCYNKDKYGNWYLMDDDKIQRVTIEDVLNKEAYILLYVNIENIEGSCESELLNVNAIQIDLPTINYIKLAQKEDNKLSLIISELETHPNIQTSTQIILFVTVCCYRASILRVRNSTKRLNK